MRLTEVAFSHLLAEIIDNRGRTCPTADEGIPLIATNCVRNELLYPSHEGIRFVSPETYATWFRGHPRPGDILFVNKGTPGRVCLVPDPVSFCIAQDMVALRPDPQRVYPRYLFAVLRAPLVQERIAQLHVGSLIPHFKKGDFNKLTLPMPSRTEQEFIGDAYFAICAKIDLNRQMSATLEAMARALFESWFVRFDPVRAKAEGRATGLPAEIADLFPDSFEQSEIGEVPKGWRVGGLRDIAQVTMGQSPPGETYNDAGSGLPFYQGKTDFGSRFPTRRIWCSAPTRFADASDVLVSVRAPVGSVNIATERCAIGRGLASVKSTAVGRSYLFYSLLALEDQFSAYEAGGTVFGSINKEQLGSLAVTIAPPDVLDAFEQHGSGYDSGIHKAHEETLALVALRDTLLPRLISGDLRVPDAERFLADAGV